MIRARTFVLFLAACGPSRVSYPPQPAPALSNAGQKAGPTPIQGDVVLRGRGDLWGHGKDIELALLADGTIAAGALRGKTELSESEHRLIDDQASIRVVEVDRRTKLRGVLLTVQSAADEDPPNRYQLFLAEGQSLRRVLDLTIGTYGVTELVFAGDGTASFVEDGWTACERMKYEATLAKRHRVTLGLAADRSKMAEIRRAPSGQQQRCNDLAACPYVYVAGASGPVRVGEILRNMRKKASYGLQSLELPRPSGRKITVVISEEKREVTYLDELYLEVDGVRIAPQSCGGVATPQYCSKDGSFHRLGHGGRLELGFSLPPSVAAARLWARGYYLPTPTLHRRRPPGR